MRHKATDTIATILFIADLSTKMKHSKGTPKAQKAQKITRPGESLAATTSLPSETKTTSSKKSRKSKKRKATNAAVESNSKRIRTLKTPPPTQRPVFQTPITYADTTPFDFEELLVQEVETDVEKKSPDPEIPLTPEELKSNACEEVENNSAFFAAKVPDSVKLDLKAMANYIRSVTKARKKAQEADPVVTASDLPTWNHEKDNDHQKGEALKMLHGIQSINIWLIDYCVATSTPLCKKHDYTKMLAIYVGKLPRYMLGKHSTNTNSFFSISLSTHRK